MSVIAFANQKGGVGKTMTIAAVASILVQEGYKVLMINLDPQRNLDMVAGAMGEELEIKRTDEKSKSILDVLKGECLLEEAIVPSSIGDLVRASNKLYGWIGNKVLAESDHTFLVQQLVKGKQILESVESTDNIEDYKTAYLQLNRVLNIIGAVATKEGTLDIESILLKTNLEHLILENALRTVKHRYDYVLIDTNPTLSLLTLNALYSTEYVVIPAFPEASAIEATLELFETIDQIKKANPTRFLKPLGVLTTKHSTYRNKSKRNQVILKGVVENLLGSYLFETKIRESERASEYVEVRQDVVRHDPTGNTSMDYRAFVKEMKLRIATLSAEKEGVYG